MGPAHSWHQRPLPGAWSTLVIRRQPDPKEAVNTSLSHTGLILVRVLPWGEVVVRSTWQATSGLLQ